MPNFDHLKLLIATLKHINLIDRIFRWKKINSLLVDAAGNLAANEITIAQQQAKINFLSNQLQLMEQESDLLEDDRKQKTEAALDSLQKIEDRIRAERADEIEKRSNAELQRIASLKQTWVNHENTVKGMVRSIAQQHTIDYIEKVPFKGTPDNTLLICEEYVVFDAKSPGTDDLKNFPNYTREQAERAQKYAKQQDVKTDIFFVVPSNTLESLRQFVYKFPDYTVYIISIDALEPVILNLKRIEEYEFAKELTPEDRNNICRVLGRFAHLSKRRIQIDSFFARQFIELAYKTEASLPPDILEMVMEFERSEKLNPPQEKRTKAIPLSELEKESGQVKHDAGARGISMEDSSLADKLNEHPLY